MGTHGYLGDWLVGIPEPSFRITTTTLGTGDLDGDDLVVLSSKNRKALPGIKHIQFNEKTGHTAIMWSDNTSTVVRCDDSEHFERYAGFCAAIVKKLFGSTSAAKKMMEQKDSEKVRARREEERLAKAEEQRKLEAANRERKKDQKARRVMGLIDKMNEDEISSLLSTLLGKKEETHE